MTYFRERNKLLSQTSSGKYSQAQSEINQTQKSTYYIISFILNSKWTKLSQGDKAIKTVIVSGGGWDSHGQGS